MVLADSQTGGKPYFNPLRTELIDCCTAIKDVSGGATYGSGIGFVDSSKPQSPIVPMDLVMVLQMMLTV